MSGCGPELRLLLCILCYKKRKRGVSQDTPFVCKKVVAAQNVDMKYLQNVCIKIILFVWIKSVQGGVVMYWEGKERAYVVAALCRASGGFADGRAGEWLRLEKKQDLFTQFYYYEAVDRSGRRAMVGVADSQKMMAKVWEGRRFQCYYVKKKSSSEVILVFCAGEERPDDEMSAALFEMPD